MRDLARLLGEFAQPLEQPRRDPEIALHLARGIGGLPDGVCARRPRTHHSSARQHGSCPFRVINLFARLDTASYRSSFTPAYAGAADVTAEFNMNLLDQINRQLDGDLDRRNFK